MARLIAAGAKVNATDREGRSTLYIASAVSAKKAELLLKHGAIVNKRTKTGFTPLLNATRAGQVNTMRMLISKGAKVNLSNQYGVTPLHWAAGFGDSAAVLLLLDAKANVKLKDKNGRTAYEWSILMGNLEGSAGYWALNRARYK